MHDEVSVVIPGSTNKSQVQMNVQAADLEDISSLLPKINSIYDELIKSDVHDRW
jgi:aryl-alcohol dehydrogenase-like predicted oxidoreductase